MMNFLKNSQDPDLSKKYKLRAGVGLSANQIGLDKRMFVAYLKDEKGIEHEYTLVKQCLLSSSVSFFLMFQAVKKMTVKRKQICTCEKLIQHNEI
nr:peptide deformylase [Virgibacillus proomii]